MLMKHQITPIMFTTPLSAQVAQVPDSTVVLLENVRFHEGETRNDPDFAQKVSMFVQGRSCERQAVLLYSHYHTNIFLRFVVNRTVPLFGIPY